MKKRLLWFYLSLIVICGGILSYQSECKGEEKEEQKLQRVVNVDSNKKESVIEKTVEWEYPVTPDHPEWKELGSVKNKIKACRIPKEILEKMTDEQLMQAIMEFPFLIDLFLLDSEQAAVQSFERTCDAYSELLSRSSAKDVLLNEVDACINTRTIEVDAEQMWKNDALVMLVLYQDDFEGMLTAKDIKRLSELSSVIEISDEISKKILCMLF